MERKPSKAPSKTFSIPKFDALKQEINKPKEETATEEETVAQPIVTGKETAFDMEALKAAWKDYMDKMEAAGNHQETIILKEQYELNGSDIILHIANEALVPGFEKVKVELLYALRRSLENDKITLRSKVVQVDQSKMLYTDQEKFEHMKKKFPALKDLQEKLGLDPEF